MAFFPSAAPTRMSCVQVHRRLLATLLLALWLIPTPARAGALQQVLVFLGTDHARVLLVTDGALPELQTQSNPAVGQAPARARILLEGTEIAPTLAAAYQPRPGGTAMRVAQQGIQNIVFATVGNDLQVVVEMDQARTVAVSELGKRALLVDLRAPDRPPDPTLPDADVLARWMNGLSFTAENQDRPGARPRIVVDAGHGGWDTGARGCTGTQEKDVALVLARKVADGLRRTLDADVYLTRDDDTFVTLQDRAAIANSRSADLFVSIHVNAAPTEDLWGIETYFLDVATDEAAARVAARENAASPSGGSDPTQRVITDLVVSGTGVLSRKLAHEVHQSVVTRLTTVFGEEQIRDLGVKSAMFYVLVSTRMPSILFETSFLTNPDEEMRLRTPAFQQETAAAIVAGIAQYLKASGS